MFKILALIWVLFTLTCSLEPLSNEALLLSLEDSKKIWIVQRGGCDESLNDVLKGVFTFACVSEGPAGFQLYGDDRKAPVSYEGPAEVGKIVEFALNNVDSII